MEGLSILINEKVQDGQIRLKKKQKKKSPIFYLPMIYCSLPKLAPIQPWVSENFLRISLPPPVSLLVGTKAGSFFQEKAWTVDLSRVSWGWELLTPQYNTFVLYSALPRKNLLCTLPASIGCTKSKPSLLGGRQRPFLSYSRRLELIKWVLTGLQI